MRFSFRTHGSILKNGALLMCGAATFFLAGCGQSSSPPTSASGTAAVDDHDGHDHDGHDHGPREGHAEEEAGHDHAGWWCTEHGVPEEVCTRCDSSLISGFKEKSDWCDDHDRPDSQCFVCHPELEAKFAARFEAKFGEAPPQPTDP
jgi:cobalt-zinc-cadmium efflux system membrane fusion protein